VGTKYQLLALTGALVAVLAGCGSTKTTTVTQTVTTTVTKTVTVTTTPTSTSAAPCIGSDLGGGFAGVEGSAGAGQITYTLTLTNTSSAACSVSGVPELHLLDAQGGALPTNATAQPGQPSPAPTVVLQPGASAKADARFSPDVPGTGETQTGPCEATAHTLEVTIGGSSTTVPITPPTPVCEHGSMNLTQLAAA
jgi:Protein of unknown function (DUF4232)